MFPNGVLRYRHQAAVTLLLLASVFPLPAGAQRVEGTLTDREDGSFVEGALIILVDSAGQELTGRLSDERGVFRLSAPEAGVYRLRVVRIGYATLLSDPFSVIETETTVVDLVASKEAIPLRGIEVEGVQGCQIRPEEGLAVALVWEAVQKALTLQSWTDREGLFRFEVLLYTQDLDQRAQPTESQDLVKTELLASTPMQSLPAETLVAEGFVRELDDETYEFLAPDAQVLLSNAFLNTHCLKLTVDQDSPSLIGLAFEPAVESDLPDVEGTLWVDRASGELRFLEFGYTWVPFDSGREQAGGHLEFQVLPSGAWIVRQWRIRMPTVQRTGPRTARLLGFKETGAIVTKFTRVIR